MFFKQKFDTFVRVYDDIGYIVNKSDFRDMVVSKAGAIFLSSLCRYPKDFDVLSQEIARQFVNVRLEDIIKDIKDFFNMLVEDGFIVSGETPQECEDKDTRFSYKEINPKTIKHDFSPIHKRANKSTQEFLEEHFKEKPHLFSMQIELTSRCNERCVHCYIPHENKTEDIEPSLFYSVLEQCKEMKMLGLALSGGEPMLHKNFCEFLRKCKDYDFSVVILSNLTMLTDEIIAEMKANRLSSVQVSLYSMKPEIHDSITQVKGSFENTKKGILRLVENDIPLQISCPTMTLNKDCFIDVLNWAKLIKVRTLTDYIMMARYDNTIGNLQYRLSVDEVGKIIDEIIKNDVNYQNDILSADYEKREKRDIANDIVCGVCVSSLSMVANGNIYPCPGWQGYVVGNAKETPLKDIWEYSERVKYLRGLKKKDFPQCLKCEDRLFCAMCMVRNANENNEGDPLKINKHFCEVARQNRKIVIEWKKQYN